MAKKATCAMCGDRFDAKRDPRRWNASAEPLAVGTKVAKPVKWIVCTDCFLQLAEDTYGAA